MAGQAAGNEEQGIDADVVAIAGIARREPLGSDRDPAQAIFVERPRCRFLAAALLDLDEGQNAPAPGDQIDLATRDTGSDSKYPPPLQAQPPGRERFRPPTARLGHLPVQLPPPSSSARA
jgi:hypothetical protein